MPDLNSVPLSFSIIFNLACMYELTIQHCPLCSSFQALQRKLLVCRPYSTMPCLSSFGLTINCTLPKYVVKCINIKIIRRNLFLIDITNREKNEVNKSIRSAMSTVPLSVFLHLNFPNPSLYVILLKSIQGMTTVNFVKSFILLTNLSLTNEYMPPILSYHNHCTITTIQAPPYLRSSILVCSLIRHL